MDEKNTVIEAQTVPSEPLVKPVTQKQNPLLALLVLLVVILFGSTGFLAYQNMWLQKQISGMQLTKNIVTSPKRQQVLFPYIPNFEDIQTIDLPNIFDLRGEYKYNNNLILVSLAQIVEYDPVAKTIVRVSDHKVSPCANSSTMIDNYLYIACNGYPDIKSKGVYKIDVTSGNLVKGYFQDDKVLAIKNISVTSKDRILWVSGDNGVIRMDTTDDSYKFYSLDKVGCTTGTGVTLYQNNMNSWIVATCGTNFDKTISVYNDVADSWKAFTGQEIFGKTTDTEVVIYAVSKDTIYLSTYPSSNSLMKYDKTSAIWQKYIENTSTPYLGNTLAPLLEFKNKYFPDAALNQFAFSTNDGNYSYSNDSELVYFEYYDSQNMKPVDGSLTIPAFIGTSNLVNSKYYIFARTSIYTLVKGEFPKFVKSLNTVDSSMTGEKTYVSPDEKYAVLAGNLFGGPGFTGPYFAVDLIDIGNGTVTNLVQKTSNSPDFKNGEYISTKDGVILQDQKTKSQIFSVNFINKALNF